ncbi:MAG: hypothetical protein ACK58L_16005 [Planctomycetota bacterium]
MNGTPILDEVLPPTHKPVQLLATHGFDVNGQRSSRELVTKAIDLFRTDHLEIHRDTRYEN